MAYISSPNLEYEGRRQVSPWHTEGAHPHWGGQSALLSLPTQMLVSPRNTLTDMSRISNQIPKAQSSSHIKLSITPTIFNELYISLGLLGDINCDLLITNIA